MTAPRRIQLSRKKGWRMPETTVSVARPTRWGNPFDWRACPAEAGPPEWARGAAVDLFRDWIYGRSEVIGAPTPPKLDAVRTDLRGKNLACWCPLDQPCHADVLLALANAPLRCEAADG